MAALPRVALGAAVAVTAALGVSVAARSADGGPATARSAAPALLPDLRQEVPALVELRRVPGPGGAIRERLGFRSAVEDVGDGPLVIEGRRRTLAEPELAAEQLVRHADGTSTRVPGAGRLRYTESPDHEHWHLLGFARYELRDGAGRRVVRDRKTGFCLGDRYRSALAPRLPATPRHPPYTGDCAGGERDRLRVRQGISVGYGDDYAPQLEGQFLDVTAVPDGTFALVHRADPERRLRQTTTANDVASVAVRLARGPGGRRTVAVLARCPGTARCPAPR